MLKLGHLFTLISLSLACCLAHALPKNIQLQYDLTRNSKQFAVVKETFTQNGKEYRIQSVTKGLGVYALMGERIAISTGVVSRAGLKPSRFELRQGKSAKKTLIAEFNWAENTINMQSKGETKTLKLEAGTQDLVSYAYQFMYLYQLSPPSKDVIKVNLTTGKNLNQYEYKVIARSVMITAADTNYKTIHISKEAGAQDDKKQLWLAEEQFYLPVRYTLKNENGESFEQTLTKIHVE